MTPSSASALRLAASACGSCHTVSLIKRPTVPGPSAPLGAARAA